MRTKRPDKWTRKNWQLHYDNAPSHSADVIKDFLAKNNTALVRQPPYSPDLAPCDFWLFHKFKITLKGTRFQSRKDTGKKRRRSSGAFQRSSRGASESGRDGWEKCVHLQGEYFKDQIKALIFIVLRVLCP